MKSSWVSEFCRSTNHMIFKLDCNKNYLYLLIDYSIIISLQLTIGVFATSHNIAFLLQFVIYDCPMVTVESTGVVSNEVR